MNSSERRNQILTELRTAEEPIPAGALAKKLSVSRQIIVGDVALLRAAGEPVTATPRGYVLQVPEGGTRRTVACRHTPEEMEWELNLMVDQGCTVENVIVEHAVYGQLSGELALSSRYDVSEFMKNVRKSGAKPLCDLTDGIHLHTIRCRDQEMFERVVRALEEAGFLLREEQHG